MDKKLEQLIERYNEKRQIIELKKRHRIEELAFEAKINLKEAFIDTDDAKEFGDYDQFFKDLHQELIVKQEEFNKTSQAMLEVEKQRIYNYFTQILGSDDNDYLGTDLVEQVMEQTMAELEGTIFDGVEVAKVDTPEVEATAPVVEEPVISEPVIEEPEVTPVTYDTLDEMEVVSEEPEIDFSLIEELTASEPSLKDAIHEEKAPSDMVSTIDLEDLLKEIRTTIDK